MSDTSLEARDADLLARARALVIEHQRGSTSLVQRHLQIGWNRAAELLAELERDGVVGPINGEGGRAVMIQQRAKERAKPAKRAPQAPTDETKRLRRLKESQELGTALGKLVVFIRAHQEHEDRIEALEREVRELRRSPSPTQEEKE